jgi:putative tryptophan/tyrosine transport system substrate-binding protein
MTVEHQGLPVSRRRFVQGAGVAGLGLLAGCGLPSSAPPAAARVYRIGFLKGGPVDAEDVLLIAAFRQGLSDLGYVEGQNLVIEERNADGDGDQVVKAAELVGLQPEVIVVVSATVARSALAATTTIPIVSAGPGDMVGLGLVVSLARPGGNVTGLTVPSLAGKQLQLLHETVPQLSRAGVLFDTANTGFRPHLYEAAARTLGLQVQFVGVGGPEELEPAFETALREHVDGLLVGQGGMISANHRRIAELAIQHRLPSVWQHSDAAGRGGLMAYAPNRAGMYRYAASYVDKILKGAKPADLPIEQPREFDFAINLKTAQALGLTIPPHVLLQATEVIQ